MTRTLFAILLSLIVVGCGGTQRSLQHWVYVENIYAREMAQYQNIQDAYYDINIQKAFYHTFTTNIEQLEKLRADTLEKCKKDWRNKFILGFENLDDGCSFSSENDEKIRNSKKFKDLIIKLENDKNKKEEAKKQAKREEELKIKKEKIAKVELVYSGKCKKFKQGSSEYENCLFDNEKLALEEQKRLATLPPSERYAYTCEKTYGFRKGTDNFKECVFKIMTTEYEMQNQLNQRRIAELERKVASNQANNAYQSEMLEIERMKAKAMQDQVNFAKNKDITDTLLGISSNLLSNSNRPTSNAPQMFNCQTRKFGGFDQIQCF
jgi:hypothetical protein